MSKELSHAVTTRGQRAIIHLLQATIKSLSLDLKNGHKLAGASIVLVGRIIDEDGTRGACVAGALTGTLNFEDVEAMAKNSGHCVVEMFAQQNKEQAKETI